LASTWPSGQFFSFRLQAAPQMCLFCPQESLRRCKYSTAHKFIWQCAKSSCIDGNPRWKNSKAEAHQGILFGCCLQARKGGQSGQIDAEVNTLQGTFVFIAKLIANAGSEHASVLRPVRHLKAWRASIHMAELVS
jgi:hypothetical protein